VAGAASLTRCPCVVVIPLPAPALVAVAAVALAAAVLSHLGPSVSSFVSLYAVVPRDTKRPPAADPLVGRRSVTAFTSRLIGRAGRTGDAEDIWSATVGRPAYGPVPFPGARNKGSGVEELPAVVLLLLHAPVKMSGDDLLSLPRPSAVPSAQTCLASGFGMEPGVSSTL